MAIMAIFSAKEITKKHYESLRPVVKWEKDHPQGAIFHACSFDDKGGLRVTDVWDSAEAMTEFVESRLLPAMKKLNIPAPTVEVFPLHNMNVYPSADKFRLVKGK
jgi:hypothetical protein